jgi:predicted nucleotidyltransferase
MDRLIKALTPDLSYGGRVLGMDRETLIQIVREALPEMIARYGVLHLDLFGSFARNEAGPDSDVDFLVTFQGEPTFARYMGLKEDLEMLLDRGIDLVPITDLKARIKDSVLSESLRVA